MDIAEHLLIPFVEIEVRFGTLNSNYFDSSVDANYFRTINSALEKGEWKQINKIFTKEYYKKKEKLRLIELIDESQKKTLIMKENILNKNIQLKNSPFDIRFSINQELLLNSYIETFDINDDSLTIREKCRHSYCNDNFKYDLTYVVQTYNNVKKEIYEVELEILQNDETTTWDSSYINNFIECKIYDIVNIVEPIDRNTFTINLTE